MQRRVDVQGKVHHVGLLQQVDLGLQDLRLRVHPLHLQELQQREHQVAVQVVAHLQGRKTDSVRQGVSQATRGATRTRAVCVKSYCAPLAVVVRPSAESAMAGHRPQNRKSSSRRCYASLECARDKCKRATKRSTCTASVLRTHTSTCSWKGAQLGACACFCAHFCVACKLLSRRQALSRHSLWRAHRRATVA